MGRGARGPRASAAPLIFTLLACTAPPDPATWTPAGGGPLWSEEVGPPIPVPAALAGLDWLADPSAWGWHGTPAGRADRGSLGVGNGIVFALVGLDGGNTVSNAIGPGYQADAGFFPDTTLALAQDGVPLPVDDTDVQRPRGTAIVRVRVASGALDLLTTDVAPPGVPVVVRHVAVQNHGDAAAEGLTLTGMDAEVARGDRTMRTSCDAVDIGTLAPGAEWSTTCRSSFSSDGTYVEDTDAREALTASRAATTAWLAEAATLDTPDPKVADLVEGMLVTLHTQTTPTGIVSPMSRYTSGWLRDSEGPVRLYLRVGLHDDAAALLDAVFATAVAEASISNSFSLDHDLDAVELPDDPDTFWATAAFMPGRNPVEAPSYPVLLHGALEAWTGVAPDAQRAAYLRACLERQQVGDAGLFPFSGDETWRYPLAAATGEGLPEDVGWSANSAMLYDAAASVLDLPGVGTDAWWSGDYWAPIARYGDLSLTPAPYEDVAMQPLWWGAAGDREATNLDAVVTYLMAEDGAVGSSPMMTGMVQGYFLQNVSRLHRDEEDLAFAAIDRFATPSGHFEELHGPDGRPLDVVHLADGLGADVPARYRPWEGGDVVAAVFDHLVGLDPVVPRGRVALAPHLPPGWPSFRATGLRVGAVRLDLVLEGYAEGLVVRLTRDVPTPWVLALSLHTPAARVWVDGVLHEAEGSTSTLTIPWTDTSLEVIAEAG